MGQVACVDAQLLRRSPLTVRNDTWQEFVRLRAQLDAVLTELLADALGHPLDDRVADIRVGRVIGALRVILELPHAQGVGETLRYRLKAAHELNRRGAYPCGCGKLKACSVDGVDARSLLDAIACDPVLHLDDWQISTALAGVEPAGPRGPALPPADYDRVGLDEAIVAALAAGGEEGMTAAELLDVLGEEVDVTSSRIGARLRGLRTRGLVTDWTFEDGRFERRVWELVQPDRAV